MNLLNKIETTLRNSNLSPSKVSVVDVRGDLRHLIVNITSDSFQNTLILEQHKMVYKVLDEFFQSGEIHAIKINTSI